MNILVDLLSWALFLCGAFLTMTGGIGVLRFPDVYSRIHAASLTDTLAAPLMLTGLILQLGWTFDSLKVLLIILFILITSPTSSHAMARAALSGAHRPVLKPAPNRSDPSQHEEGSSSTP